MAFHISILQGSPSCSPEPDMLKKTEMGNTMPRSLTIDEMEHICRHVINFVNIEKMVNEFLLQTTSARNSARLLP